MTYWPVAAERPEFLATDAPLLVVRYDFYLRLFMRIRGVEHFRKYFHAFVRRTVVDEDVLDIGQCLLEKRLQATLDKPLCFIYGNNDANGWGLHRIMV